MENTANDTYKLSSSCNWLATTKIDEHIFTLTKSKKDQCNITSQQCQNTIACKYKCVSCHTVAHVHCLDHLKDPCRPTFRLSSMEGYRENRNVIMNSMHHWVRKMSPVGKCKFCEKSTSTTDSSSFQCSWCKVFYHDSRVCFPDWRRDEMCSFGESSEYIVPPTWIIQLSDVKVPESSSSQFVVKPFPSTSRTPLLVFIDPQEDFSAGYKVMSHFQWLLNPRQVYLLDNNGLTLGLKLYGNVPNLRIFVYAGSSAINLITATMDMLKINPHPPIALMPCGFGSDLASTTNWGDEDVEKVMDLVKLGFVTPVDRWRASGEMPIDPLMISSTQVRLKRCGMLDDQDQLKEINFTSYFSLGLDAAIMLAFNAAKAARPDKFQSKIRSRLHFFQLSMENIRNSNYEDLHNQVKIKCDDLDITSQIKENSCQCVIFLNIPFYGDGNRLWNVEKLPAFKDQNISDGLIEVVGLTKSQLMTGYGAVHLSQCSTISITTSDVIAIHVDGESCRLNPSRIQIKTSNQTKLVVRPDRTQLLKFRQLDYYKYCTASRYRINLDDSRKFEVRLIPLTSLFGGPTLLDSLLQNAKLISTVNLALMQNLIEARNAINETEYFKDLNNWIFLDYNLTDQFVKLSKEIEYQYFVMDIQRFNCIYITL